MLGQTSMGVDKSISKVNDQLSNQLNPQEVGSLVQNQTRTEKAAGNSWRHHLQRFKMLDSDEQFRTICASAGFIRPVSVGMYWRTSDDMKLWIWKSHSIMWRVYINSCSSRFCGQALVTKTCRDRGQSLKSRFSVILTKHGIEIQIPCTSGGNTNVWVVICRCPNRYVDELRYKDPEPSPENLGEADNGSMQETDAEQPTIQSGPQCSLSDDHIPIRERKWEDITANEFSHKFELGYHIPTFVGKLVRHENQHDREADGQLIGHYL